MATTDYLALAAALARAAAASRRADDEPVDPTDGLALRLAERDLASPRCIYCGEILTGAARAPFCSAQCAIDAEADDRNDS